MDLLTDYASVIAENWSVWLVTVVLVLAAVIDGFELKVPNWVTFPFIVSGWLYSTLAFGWEGLGWSLLGTVMGLALLLPAYAIGGMGAGDVKLLAGVGAWVYGTHTVYAFAVSAVVGAVLASAWCWLAGDGRSTPAQFMVILNEILVIRNPEQLAADCRPAKAHDVAAALWHSDRDRNHRLLCLDGDACMNTGTTAIDAVTHLLSSLWKAGAIAASLPPATDKLTTLPVVPKKSTGRGGGRVCHRCARCFCCCVSA